MDGVVMKAFETPVHASKKGSVKDTDGIILRYE